MCSRIKFVRIVVPDVRWGPSWGQKAKIIR